MSDSYFWFGQLEAGEKSSPVLIDNRIDTGNPATVYIFNLKRNEILEYRREIIEAKLHELNDKEQDLREQLQSAYIEVRTQFVPRGGNNSLMTPGKGPKRPKVAANDDAGDDAEEFIDDALEDENDEWPEEEEA